MAAINGFFDRKDFSNFGKGFELETEFIRNLTKNVKINTYCQSNFVYLPKNSCNEKVDFNLLKNRRIILLEVDWNIQDGLQFYAYPEFGLYIYQSNRLFLSFRCGSISHGHSHIDHLSVELNVDGQDLIADPGSYIYTALPKARNLYRSSLAHFGGVFKKRPYEHLSDNLFNIKDTANARCLFFGEKGVFGVHFGYNFPFYRKVEISSHKIELIDGLKVSAKTELTDKNILLDIPFQGTVFCTTGEINFSNGYGKRYAFV